MVFFTMIVFESLKQYQDIIDAGIFLRTSSIVSGITPQRYLDYFETMNFYVFIRPPPPIPPGEALKIMESW